MVDRTPTLISLSGLPGVGKTTLARAFSTQIRAIHLRVDSVEAALKRSAIKIDPAKDAGYRALAAIAQDNLLLGFNVITDTVNPFEITRQLWTDTAWAGRARFLNVEVICSDTALHRERVEQRTSDLTGLVVPSWDEVKNRAYAPWDRDRLIVDTATQPSSACAAAVVNAMRQGGSHLTTSGRGTSS